MVSLYWLHDRTRRPGGPRPGREDRQAVLRLDRALRALRPLQRQGRRKFGLDNHGVNNGMGLKFGGMRYRRTGDAEGPRRHRHACSTGSTATTARPPASSPATSTTPAAAPSQGTELCTVAEAMYSLELLEGITGDARLGDRLERLAFNAFPATFKKDMCAPPVRPAGEPGRRARSPTRGSTPTTARTRTSTAWSRTSAAAPPTCTRAGPSSRRHLWGAIDRRRARGDGLCAVRRRRRPSNGQGGAYRGRHRLPVPRRGDDQVPGARADGVPAPPPRPRMGGGGVERIPDRDGFQGDPAIGPFLPSRPGPRQ